MMPTGLDAYARTTADIGACPAVTGCPAPGLWVTPHVVLTMPLASGSMGEIWIAEHVGLDTRVAVKFIARELITNETAVARFHREATAAARISSAHVVRHFDHGNTGGLHYIVMELLHGQTLGARLESGPMGLRAVATVVTQVSEGLAAAHGVGVCHRDIKPDNIFLSDAPGAACIKILDFGVAAETRPRKPGAERKLTHCGVLLGTPPYMSPQHVMGLGACHKAGDLWALAVVAYEALTDSLPFDGETIVDVFASIRSGRFDPPSRRRAGLGAAVDAWFKRALHPAPEQRFADARELARTFRRLVVQNAVPPQSPSTTPRLVPPPRAVHTARLLAQTLMRVAPHYRKHHPAVIGEALHQACLSEVPRDIPFFRRFAKSSLRASARKILGEELAQRITRELLSALGIDPTDTLPMGERCIDGDRESSIMRRVSKPPSAGACESERPALEGARSRR